MTKQLAFSVILEGWRNYQQHLITAVAPLTSDQLSFQIAPQLRSVMTLTAHIISARVWWFHLVMKEGPESLASMVKWDDEGEPVRTAVELVEGLNQTWIMIEDCLNRWTLADLDEMFQLPWPGDRSPQTFTRQWIVWHILEHDLHHGGELSFSLGACGLPAINL